MPKFVCVLPPRQHYISLLTDSNRFPKQHPMSSNGDRYLFEDHRCKTLRINSPVPDPFGQQWILLVSPQKQKSDHSEYPYRIVFKLFEQGSDVIPATLTREIYKGTFAWSGRPTIATYSFPLGNNLWLSYSFE